MRTIIIASMLLTIALAGCKRKPDSAKPAAPPASGAKVDEHSGGGKHDAHGGASIELGAATVGGMTIKAARDAGELKAGGDAPIDVWIDGGLGDAAAVRFWIGAEDAKGAIKAKAEVEDGKWHTHVELPDPLPAGAKLWVEIEGKDGKRAAASFDLKQ